MLRKSISALLAVASLGLHSNRKYNALALRSTFLTRAPPSAFLFMMINSRQASSQDRNAELSLNEANYTSDIKEWKVEDVTFINSSVAKAIDDDLMFNNGSAYSPCIFDSPVMLKRKFAIMIVSSSSSSYSHLTCRLLSRPADGISRFVI